MDQPDSLSVFKQIQSAVIVGFPKRDGPQCPLEQREQRIDAYRFSSSFIGSGPHVMAYLDSNSFGVLAWLSSKHSP